MSVSRELQSLTDEINTKKTAALTAVAHKKSFDIRVRYHSEK